jgi:hypothetical protein
MRFTDRRATQWRNFSNRQLLSDPPARAAESLKPQK